MIIKTKQFILRPLKKSDLADFVKNINDKEISKNMARVPYPFTIKDGRKSLKRVIGKARIKGNLAELFAIEIDKEMAGCFNISHIEKGHKCAIGYWPVSAENYSLKILIILFPSLGLAWSKILE